METYGGVPQKTLKTFQKPIDNRNSIPYNGIIKTKQTEVNTMEIKETYGFSDLENLWRLTQRKNF